MMINDADSLIDLKAPPSNKLENSLELVPMNIPSESTGNGGFVFLFTMVMHLMSESKTITDRELSMINESSKAQDTIPTPTIGMILQEEFLRPLDITPERLARELNVSSSTVLDLIHDKSLLTTPMALRLSRLFGTSERFWINLQTDIDIRNRKPEMESELAAIRPIELPA